ncbi:MAG: hypothetical protein P0116_16185 [Candidatus Nitrosocosmicus sp.]|nr:hypothetical protein [Candidatus Nitrosocosmicus sp.]
MVNSMTTNPIPVTVFQSTSLPINYYYFEGISHRLIINFSLLEPELILMPQNNMIGEDKSYNQVFIKVGTACIDKVIS